MVEALGLETACAILVARLCQILDGTAFLVSLIASKYPFGSGVKIYLCLSTVSSFSSSLIQKKKT